MNAETERTASEIHAYLRTTRGTQITEDEAENLDWDSPEFAALARTMAEENEAFWFRACEIAEAGELLLDLHLCTERRSFAAIVAPTTAAHAAAARYLAGRLDRLAIEEIAGYSEGPLYALLHPQCSHGLSLNLCEGPDHYLTADQERARGW